MKGKKKLWLVLLTIAVFGVLLTLRMVSYECRVTMRQRRQLTSDAGVFRLRCAVEHLSSKSEIDKMLARLAPVSSTDRERKWMRECLETVRVDVVKDSSVVVVVTTENGSRDVLKLVGELVADELRRYFESEYNELREKMTAWFEQEIRYRAKNGEDVSELKRKMADALQEAEDGRIEFCDAPGSEVIVRKDVTLGRWLIGQLSLSSH